MYRVYIEPNQGIQSGFGGPIFDYKVNEIYFLAAIDRFPITPLHGYLTNLTDRMF